MPGSSGRCVIQPSHPCNVVYWLSTASEQTIPNLPTSNNNHFMTHMNTDVEIDTAEI